MISRARSNGSARPLSTLVLSEENRQQLEQFGQSPASTEPSSGTVQKPSQKRQFEEARDDEHGVFPIHCEGQKRSHGSCAKGQEHIPAPGSAASVTVPA